MRGQENHPITNCHASTPVSAHANSDQFDTMTTELSFTGERFLPNLAGEMWAEHWHRYHFVLPLVAGKKVLDVASGEGYGSALIASKAVEVIGLDVSAEAVAHANDAYADRQNVTFMQGSCAKLPFDDATFDVIVSFETIEHISKQNEFLDEIKRVLKRSGLLIMSSPNRAEYSDARGYANEFHVKELYRAEFADLLGARFQHLHWFSQRNAFVSMLVPEALETPGATMAISAETLTISKARPDTRASALPALYFLVVASNDNAIKSLPLPLSVFSDSEEWAYNDYRKIYQASQSGSKREAALAARCDALEEQISAMQTQSKAAPNANPTAAPRNVEQTWLARLLKRLSS